MEEKRIADHIAWLAPIWQVMGVHATRSGHASHLAHQYRCKSWQDHQVAYFFKKKRKKINHTFTKTKFYSLSLSVVFMLFFSWPGHTESQTTSVELKSKLVKIVFTVAKRVVEIQHKSTYLP
jgi:hypothetical protein